MINILVAPALTLQEQQQKKTQNTKTQVLKHIIKSNNNNDNQVEKRDKKSQLIKLLRDLGGSKTLVFLRLLAPSGALIAIPTYY